MILDGNVSVALDSSIVWASALLSMAIIYHGFVISKAVRTSNKLNDYFP